MAFSPDGKLIASSSNNNIELWDTATGEHQKTLIGDSGLVSAVAFSADGKQIVSSSMDKTINLWDLKSSFKASKYLGRAIDRRLKLRPWRVIKTPENITTVKFSPDNCFIITNIGPIWLKARPADDKSAIFGSLPDILYTRDQWIWLGELRILRLLPESVPRCYDIRGDQIVIGLENGQVLLLNVEKRSVR
ncbi:hypothetical protein N7494_001956 [Penicillium frequentans]|uniref:Mitochondrial division protein 1 n=1 Tax=Penicillium frequentans TaxID=3151616 RepID=A0AAD6D4R7_9EURO|nr:hypothetical protein N7494_001956 [Penicillium glabrum]